MRSPREQAAATELLRKFEEAVKHKMVGDMRYASWFIEDFDELTEVFPKELRDKLRRGMFLILR